MNKQQWKAVVAIHNASIAALADTPNIELSDRDYQRLEEAQIEWGYSILRRYGFDSPFGTFEDCIEAIRARAPLQPTPEE